MAENQLNPIYFANEFGDPDFVLHLNISFSLSNKSANYKKNSVDPIFKKLQKRDFSFVKKICLFIT